MSSEDSNCEYRRPRHLNGNGCQSNRIGIEEMETKREIGISRFFADGISILGYM
jgi:hypothetical protein